jgi:hypothetical protein
MGKTPKLQPVEGDNRLLRMSWIKVHPRCIILAPRKSTICRNKTLVFRLRAHLQGSPEHVEKATIRPSAQTDLDDLCQRAVWLAEPSDTSL